MPDQTPIARIGPDGARALLEGGALLLDVREADEWTAGHAPDALWIPVAQVGERLSELPPGRSIVAICRSGVRSARVAEALDARGYDVANLEGGMRAWVAAGFDCVTDAGTPGRVA